MLDPIVGKAKSSSVDAIGPVVRSRRAEALDNGSRLGQAIQRGAQALRFGRLVGVICTGLFDCLGLGPFDE